jgi:hypothetical protein
LIPVHGALRYFDLSLEKEKCPLPEQAFSHRQFTLEVAMSGDHRGDEQDADSKATGEWSEAINHRIRRRSGDD